MTSLRAEILADAPYSYWPLEGPLGAIAPEIAGVLGSNGTIVGGAVAVVDSDAPTGWALDLDGVNDQVTAPDTASPAPAGLTGLLTVEAWAFIDAIGGGRRFIVSKGTSGAYEWSLSVTAAGTLQGSVWNPAGTEVIAPSLTTTTPLLTGRWYHVAMVYDRAGTSCLYINGAVAVSSSTYTSSLSNTTSTVSIGYRQDGGDGVWFDGRIAHVAIYFNVALSAARILAHYNAAKSVPVSYTDYILDQPSVIAHYPLQETAGTVADGINDGTISATGVTYSLAGPSGAIPLALGTDGTTGEVALPTPLTASIGPGTAQTWMWWFYTSAAITSASTPVYPFGSRTSSATGVGFGSITSFFPNEVVTVYNDSGGADDRTAWTGFIIPAGWHHHALSYSGTQNGWTYYLDGVATGTKVSNSGGSFGFISSQQFSIGRNFVGYNAVERVAALSVFRAELTATHVAALYRAGRVVSCPHGLTIY